MLTLRPTAATDELAAYDEQDGRVATLRAALDGVVVVYSEIELLDRAAADEVTEALRRHADGIHAQAATVRVDVQQTELLAALSRQHIVSRIMYRPAGDAPAEAPAEAGYRALSGSEYDRWRAENIEHYAREAYLERLHGDVAEARRLATASYDELLPDGRSTADTSLVVLTAAGARVGTLWLRHRTTRYPVVAERMTFIYGIDIDAERRGEGWGKAGLAIAEQLAVAAGDPGVGLNVFADNTVANGLYRASGFEVVQQAFDLRQPAAT